MMSSPMNQLCRLCLQNDNQPIEIFSDYGFRMGLQAKIWKLYRIWIKFDEPLPKKICHNCFFHIEKFYKVSFKVEQVQTNLDFYMHQDIHFDRLMMLSQNLTCKSNDSKITQTEINFEDIDSNGIKRYVKRGRPRRCETDEGILERPNLQSHGQIIRLGRSTLAQFYNYACSVCKKGGVPDTENTFSNFPRLCAHYESHHGQRGYVICCSKRLFSRKSVRTHFLKHNQPELFRCNLCGKQLANSRCLEMHKLRHSTNRPFRCSECCRAFVFKEDLAKHTRTHLPDELTLIHRCNHCGKRFKHLTTLMYHIKSIHLRLTTEICHVCAKIFTHRSVLEAHMLTHSEGEELLACPVCQKKMKNKLTLKNHMKIHESNANYSCPMCSKVFKIKTRLTHHLKTHTIEKQFKCGGCLKYFKQKSSLKLHISQHCKSREANAIEVLASMHMHPQTQRQGSNYEYTLPLPLEIKSPKVSPDHFVSEQNFHDVGAQDLSSLYLMNSLNISPPKHDSQFKPIDQVSFPSIGF